MAEPGQPCERCGGEGYLFTLAWPVTLLLPAACFAWLAYWCFVRTGGMGYRTVGLLGTCALIIGYWVLDRQSWWIECADCDRAGEPWSLGGRPEFDAQGARSKVVLTANTLCRQCKYNLRGLDKHGRCPECGTPIRRSLIAGRFNSRETPWQVALSWTLLLVPMPATLAGLFGLVGLLWGVVFATGVIACDIALRERCRATVDFPWETDPTTGFSAPKFWNTVLLVVGFSGIVLGAGVAVLQLR